jgi:pyruvate/2-oxoglutarate dehydrogenase complex dihydrolipoamide acyltransferase (E2) component
MHVAVNLATEETLDYADRWLRDGLSVVRPPFSVLQTTVDMTHALQRLEELRHRGTHATATHLLVQAAARALAANPQLHQVVAGIRRHRPDRVDIGLSVNGETFVSPVLVIEGADQKSIADIAEETTRRAPQIQQADRDMLRVLRTWGWLVPFGFLRRACLRVLFTSAKFRRKGAGTFQVSTVPLDWALSSAFTTAGVLVAGQISRRVVAVDDEPQIRPMMVLTLSGDHGVWDGRSAARFLSAVKGHLEAA